MKLFTWKEEIKLNGGTRFGQAIAEWQGMR